jgi:hypothetical protein
MSPGGWLFVILLQICCVLGTSLEFMLLSGGTLKMSPGHNFEEFRGIPEKSLVPFCSICLSRCLFRCVRISKSPHQSVNP